LNVMMLLQMAADADPDRLAIGPRDGGLTTGELYRLAGGAAATFADDAVQRVVWTDIANPALPVALFGSSWAGRPFVPVNYRLADDRLRAIIARQAPALVVCEPGTETRVAGIEGAAIVTSPALLDAARATEPLADEWSFDGDDVAILLHTSGTSGDPKVAVLRQRHLTSYVLGSVEFLAADPDEATLVTVPPYHIAGMAAILTAIYSGRRLVQLPNFEPEAWIATARREQITHAMVVPTMLARINAALATDGEGLPSLRHLAYGGGRMPLPVIEETMRLLPHVDFVNAYGLTETSSSVAVLTAEDHREALASDDPNVRRRLGSVGRPLPIVEIVVRDEAGNVVPAGTHGEVFIRGDQVSGEYAHRGPGDGWFATQDGGWFDDEGFLYVTGRLDDVIVRGGENLSPGEIEDVLLQHDAVRDACVLGIPDTEWGEAVAAVVVLHDDAHADPDELADWVVTHLRSSRRPSLVVFRTELPQNDTGKVLRRVLRDELAASEP
jgi:acyl-CoA synthetase (AMP-forming)/AMP-acid ligase II